MSTATETPIDEARAAHRLKFMATFKGIPASHVWAALGCFLHADFSGCAKGSIADDYAAAMVKSRLALFPALSRVDLERAARMADARHKGNLMWRTVT